MPAKSSKKSKLASLSDDAKKALKLKLLKGLIKPTPEEKQKLKAKKSPKAAIAADAKKKKRVAPWKKRTLMPNEASYETTLHVGRLVRSAARKERASRAIRQIKRYVRKFFDTTDVRFDPELNTYLFSQGMTNPPKRIRIRMEKRAMETEGTKSKHYFVRVSNVVVDTFKGLHTQKIEEKNETQEAPAQ